MSDAENPTKSHQVLIVGAGPSALAAALYTSREEIDTVLYEKGVIGGLAAITDQVDNYPGFPEGITGLELAELLQKQAERFGAKIELGEVTAIEDKGEKKIVKTTDGDIEARAVLISTGTDYKKLGVPGEQEFYGRGVHYCATCDGALYKDKRLIVVGGGNSAVQEGLFLTRFASEVTLVVRGDKLKATEVMAEKARNHDKIKIIYNTTTDEIVGADNRVNKVIGTNKESGQKVELETDGVFVLIGLKPNTEWLKGSDIELDEYGFVVTDKNLETNMRGVYCSGDVRSGATMQIASAVGEGATAALKIREYLDHATHEAHRS